MKTLSRASAEPAPEFPDKPRKPRTRFAKWLRMALFVLACLGTALALLDAVVNWRGKRAWEKYARNLSAAGQPLRLAEVIPPPLPHEQNFADTPFLAGLFKSEAEREQVLVRWPDLYDRAQNKLDPYLAGSRDGRSPYARWRRIDLAACQAALALVQSKDNARDLSAEDLAGLTNRSETASNVLAALQVYTPVLEELRAVSGRPGARYDVVYHTDNPLTTPLPHLALLRRICRVLQVRSAAFLALGQTEPALADIDLMLRVSESLKDEPFYVSYLVQTACCRLAMEAFREGWTGSTTWSDAQLSRMQKRWAALDFLRASQKALAAERAMGNSMFEFILRKRGTRGFPGEFGMNPDSSEERLLGRLFGVWPRGWIYLEQLNYNRSLDAFASWDIAPGGPRVDPQLVQANLDAFTQSTRGPMVLALWQHRVMSGLLLPALCNTFKKAAETQALVEMTALACAAERFRLSHETYPDNLAALSPQFIARLPNDVLSNQPYPYQRTPSGRFILYSVGWDGIDDRGQQSEDNTMGDWVWRHPAD